MKVIILSGGLGYRLKEETEFKPKPMVYVGGKPILWHIMKIYAHYGYNDFIIALGYKGDYIKEYFLNQKYFAHDFTMYTKTGTAKIYKDHIKYKPDDFKMTFIDTGLETLPGERILKLRDFIPEQDKDFMVTYGDGVSTVNIKELVEFHTKQGTIGTITGVHPKSKYGMLELNRKNIITAFTEKPTLNDWVNGGFMIFKKEFFTYIKPGEMEHEALKRLIKERQLSLYMHDGFWQSMDTYSDVNYLNQLWATNHEWKIWTD